MRGFLFSMGGAGSFWKILVCGPKYCSIELGGISHNGGTMDYNGGTSNPLGNHAVWTLTLFCYSSYLFKFNVILNLVHIYVLGLSSVGIGVFISPFIKVYIITSTIFTGFLAIDRRSTSTFSCFKKCLNTQPDLGTGFFSSEK